MLSGLINYIHNLILPPVLWFTYFLIYNPIKIFLWSYDHPSNIYLFVNITQAFAYVVTALFKSLSIIGLPYKYVRNNSYLGLCKNISISVCGLEWRTITAFLS